ncbi:MULTISPECIES: tetratricopeptide repeat protein [unclassified Bradyrhizobium]|uniref:tetratricopeptide repeat protein n=1 Tax=unclassified Bradyrhizobium TaxID=2631580 RepID=UPI0028F10629|nr:MULTISPECIES: tetratricopeptide repeat protein [unclassified Bradyrhizobium]
MPVALVVLLLDISLIYHASRTGRMQPWAFIILMVPMIGALAYIVVELVPEWLGSHDVQKARKRVANKLDPEKYYRELSDRVAVTDTIANRAALAEECVAVGRYDEAEQHYDHILSLPMGHEPLFALGKARAQFARRRPADALATLDELQKTWPDYNSSDAHLLYARALQDAGRTDEAIEEYQALLDYAPSSEAKARYGSLLKSVGRVDEAKVVFTELLIQMKRSPRHVRKAQAEWIAVAEKQIAG